MQRPRWLRPTRRVIATPRTPLYQAQNAVKRRLTAIVTLIVLLLTLGCPAIAEQSKTTARANGRSTATVLENYSFAKASSRTRLPKALREISGLVALANTRVALHTDNDALVWAFDYGSSNLSRELLVNAPISGDFEGIAQHGDDLLLSDSHGSISRFAPINTQEETISRRQRFHTAFKERCVFEGLAIITESIGATLLLPCKYPRFIAAGEAPADDNLIYIFRQQLTAQGTVDIDTGFDIMPIDVSSVLRERHLPRLRPSAIEVVNDHLLILAGKERVLLETSLTGELLAWRRLRWPRHRQAEGLTLGADGALVIADEGRWFGGTVTVYQPSTARTKK